MSLVFTYSEISHYNLLVLKYAIMYDLDMVGPCRQNLVGSLPRGTPTVVDESVEVRVRKLDGDTERMRQRFRQVQAVSST